MNAEETIFEQALGFDSAAEREAYLRGACGKDRAMLDRLQALLGAHERAGKFLEHPGRAVDQPVLAAGAPVVTASTAPLTEKAGDRIGRYKLLQKIGEGGCGVVYMAEQEEPVRRRVALKILKLGMDTGQVVARFEAERQALALMDHPNIAKVYDAGATENGRPYFVMELVRGIKITEYCDNKQVPTVQRLELFIQVCQAVQHAHQKGIIHRDLKPSNILVTVNDGSAVPKVIDFGIAKATTGERLTNKTVFTAFEQFMGTPAYMSPEQADISSVDIDTRSDVYSLGVLLYELLTAHTPFDAKELLQAGLDEMRRTIREKEPSRPSTRLSTLPGDALSTTAHRRGLEPLKLVSQLRGDLDWIVMKCLEKDRARRYETANGLAADIQRHLDNEPVVACPPGSFYRFQKMVRRNRTAFAAGATVVVALAIGLGMSTWLFLRERETRKQQVVLRQEAEAARGQARSDAEAAQIEAEKSREVVQLFKTMLEGAGPEVAKGRDATILIEIADRTYDQLTGLTNQPAVQAELCRTIASIYEDLGRYDNAVTAFRRAVTIMRGQPRVRQNVLLLGEVLNGLGTALQKSEKLPEAEAAFVESLAITRDAFGGQSDETATVLANLGDVLSNEGKVAEAETNITHALEIKRKLHGEWHHSLAELLNSLGSLKFQTEQYAEAEALFAESLAIHRKTHGDDHVEVATCLDNLASALEPQGKLSESEDKHKEALAIYRKLLGPDHPDVATALCNLGLLLEREGKLDEAEQVVRQSLDIRTNRFGTENAVVAQSLNILSEVLWKKGKFAEAEMNGFEALRIRRKTLGDENPSVIADVCNIAGILRQQQKFDQAERLYTEALSAVNPESSMRGLLLQRRGDLYAQRGRWKEAEADKASALASRPADHMVWYQLAALCVQQGRSDEYKSLCRRALERFQTTTNPETAVWISRACLIVPMQPSEAIGKMAEVALAAEKRRDRGWLVKCNKALAEYRAGRFTGALDWAQRAAQTPNLDASPQVETYSIIAMADRQLQRTDEAQAALRQASSAETKLPRLESGDLGGGCFSWIVDHALLREAADLIEHKKD